MPTDPLLPDPDSLEQWRRLPQNTPSREAHPPAMSGGRWTVGLLIALALVVIIAGLLEHLF